MARTADGPLVDEVAIEIVPTRLSWPEPGASGHDAALGGNRHYADLRTTGWRDVAEMLREEAFYLDRLRLAEDTGEQICEIESDLDERSEQEGGHPLWGLDVGVAAATVALAAAGCVTFTSCNGGAFGEGKHLESYPLVGFFMRPRLAEAITSAAAASGAGLLMHRDGSLQVYASDAWGLHGFAKAVFERRGEVRNANKVGRRSKAQRPERIKRLGSGLDDQLDLFL